MTVITASKARVLQVNNFINEVVRIPIRSTEEMNFYSDKGVTIYRNKITRNGSVSMYYFIEVLIEDLVKIAR